MLLLIAGHRFDVVGFSSCATTVFHFQYVSYSVNEQIAIVVNCHKHIADMEVCSSKCILLKE